MKEISPSQLSDNIIDLIGRKWMLITAGCENDFNTMTASWGGMGFLWNKPIATIYVRPERYTDLFINKTGSFTLTFFNEDMRPTLSFMGTKSGRDCDKMHHPMLTPITLPSGQIAFQRAQIIVECQVLYKDALKDECFIDNEPLTKWYGSQHGNLHNIYIAEIKHVWIN